MAGNTSLTDYYGYQKVKYSNGEAVRNFEGRYVYKLVNLLGDGNLVSEYYLDARKSVLNNGTIKIDKELSDAEIIEYFGGDVAEEVVPLPTEEEVVEPTEEIADEIEYTAEETLQFEINDLVQRIEELGYVQEDLDVSNIETIVLNNLPKITPVSARKETGMKTGDDKDIKYTLLSGSGISVDQAAHDIWDSNFGIDSNVTTEDVRNIIIDILSSGSKVNYKSQIGTSSEVTNLKEKLRNLKIDLSELQKGKPRVRTVKPIPGQLDLFQEEDESWKDEDNNDSCVPF
jgi:hypothetical protein